MSPVFCILAQFGLTPDKIGLVFLANALPFVLVAPLAGKLADNYRTVS